VTLITRMRPVQVGSDACGGTNHQQIRARSERRKLLTPLRAYSALERTLALGHEVFELGAQRGLTAPANRARMSTSRTSGSNAGLHSSAIPGVPRVAVSSSTFESCTHVSRSMSDATT